MTKLIEYPNGIRVVINQNAHVGSVCAGIWVGVGSVAESLQLNGISHFTEHMLFKGTDKLNAFQVADSFERSGAMVNAFTGKESTCYYFKCVDEYLDHCFGVLSHIYFDSVYRKEDLDKERNVIIEEINMVEDAPEDIAFDLLSRVNFGDQPLGQTILGTIDNVKTFDKSTIDSFRDKFYQASNIVLSFAGNCSEKLVDNIVRKYFIERTPNKQIQNIKPSVLLHSNAKSYYKKFEQSNIIVSFPSIKFNDKMSSTQSVLNTILGGGMSSRLFQTIREQAGLAYSVYTTPLAYSNCGVFNIVVNTSPGNTSQVLTRLRAELDSFVKVGVQPDEFERAKAQLKSAFVFGQESVQSCMISAGKMMISVNELFDYKKRIADIDAVTISQLNQLATQIFDFDRLSCAYVGKDTRVDLLQVLKAG